MITMLYYKIMKYLLTQSHSHFVIIISIRPAITLRYALLCRATLDAVQIRGLDESSPSGEGLL